MLAELKEALINALDLDEEDLKGFTTREIVDLAEKYCSLQFNPGAILEAADKASVNPDPLAPNKAIDLFAKGAAELEADLCQFEVGRVLADAYEHGDPELKLSPDQNKRQKYGRFPKKETSKNTDTPVLKKVTDTLGISTIEDTRNKLTWFTRFRLMFGVRLNRVLALSNNGFLNKIGIVAGIASLSYFVELFLYLGDALHDAFYPTAEQAKKTPRKLDRFVNAFKGREWEVCNAFWGLVNLIGLFASAGLTAAFNLGYFHRDFFEDSYKLYRDQKLYNILFKLITKKQKHQAALDALSQLKETPEILAQKENLIIKIAKLEQTKERLIEHKKSNRNMRVWLLAATSLILAGMILILVPQIAPVALLTGFTIKMTGSYLALSGSIINRAFLMKTKEVGTFFLNKVITLFNNKKTLEPAKQCLPPKLNIHANQIIKQMQVDYLLKKAQPDSDQIREMSEFGRQQASFLKAPPPTLRMSTSMKNLSVIAKRTKLERAASNPTVPVSTAPVNIKQRRNNSYPAAIRNGVFSTASSSPTLTQNTNYISNKGYNSISPSHVS